MKQRTSPRISHFCLAGLTLVAGTCVIIASTTMTASAMPPHPDLLKDNAMRKKLQLRSSSRTVSVLKTVNSPRRAFPTSGARRVLVLMIGFNDLAFQAGDTAEFYEKLLNGENDEALSFRKYYRDMSGGRLDIEVTVVNTGSASNDIAYYGANDGEGYDVRPATLVGEAIDRADAGGLDFSRFDNDGDGEVDVVMVIHAGRGEESGADDDTIWSHAWNLDSGADFGDGSGARIYDGVTINEYTIQPEYFLSPGDSTIGVFTHEFGHVLGLPDLYDTTYQTDGVGKWSLMAAGSWNGPGNDGSVPAPLLAWEKAYLGWISLRRADRETPAIPLPSFPPSRVPMAMLVLTSLIVLYASGRYRQRRMAASFVACSLVLAFSTMISCGGGGGKKESPHVVLEDIDESSAAAKISLGDPYGEQYYLAEIKYRKAGTWSDHLPGDGLLITHVDEYIVDELLPYNAVNSYADLDGGPIHGVGIVEADGSDDLFNGTDGDAGSAGDLFYSGHNDSLTPLTQPGSKYNRYTSTNIFPRSTASRVYITGISEIGESMSFDCERK